MKASIPTMASILIVERDASTAQLLKVRLEQAGHLTQWTQSTQETQEYLLRNSPDLIVMDMGISSDNGLDLVKRIKRTPATSHIVLILLSEVLNGEAIIAGLDAGADNVLSKPIHFTDLLHRIQQLLSRRKMARAA
jgi:DNA-binding response OmpR family regulator